MRKMIVAISVHLLAIVSFLRAYFSLSKAEQEQSTWKIGIAVICIILVFAIVWELVNHVRSSPTRYRFFKERRIRRFMRLWLSSGGRAVVFTRDMSWANAANVRDVLFEKAQRQEERWCACGSRWCCGEDSRHTRISEWPTSIFCGGRGLGQNSSCL
jgi:hypothetical protein